MSNAKRFLSVILAIIMVCSTLVIGANAAYVAYKDAAIKGNYNDLDQAVLTTEQYASAAMDEVDRMLDEEQLKFTRADIIVGDIDLTSVDRALDDAYGIVNGTLFNTLKGMLGDLKDINVSALRYEKDGGVRRTTEGKTDLDLIYCVFQFLYDNKNLLTRFVDGNLSLGSIVEGLVDISEFSDVSKLLKGLLYEATYVDENGDSKDAPDDIGTYSFDTMVQDLIDRIIANEITMDGENIGQYFVGHTNISTGTMYDFIDQALKDAYNGIAVPVLNTTVKEALGELCGVVYTKNEDGTVTVDKSDLNQYAQLLNVDYVIPAYNFTSAPVVDQLNNIIKTIADVVVNPDVFVWQAGDNSMVKTNVINLGKAALVNTGDDFFASYIDVADAATVNAMSDQEIAAYALRAIINGSVDGMYIPEEATTTREFGYYVLSQLLSTSVPELDFSKMDKNSTDTLVVMGIDYAIYSVNAELDMDLDYVYDMAGVDAQLKKAAQYGIDNYGGLFSGITFTPDDDGWSTIEKILFRIIDRSYLPAASNGSFKTFLINNLIDNILDLNFSALLALLNDCPTGSELLLTPKKVVINRVASILNTIFPGAINGNATTIDQIGTNAALSATIGAIIDDLYNYKAALAKSILPTLCSILDLTNAQEFEFPELTYDKQLNCSNNLLNYDIKIRNSSTGINTGYTYYDANGNKQFQQDSLYTYQFIGAETSVAGTTATCPTTLAGGQTGSIHLGGNVGSNTPLRVTVKYNVLTEDGSPLTAQPITEDIYMYLATAASVETAKLSTTGNVFVSDGTLNIFASSMSDLTNLQMTVENKTTSDVSVVPYSNLLTITESSSKKKPVDTNGTAWFELITEPTSISKAVTADGKTYNGTGKIDVFKTTEAYNALTKEEKQDVWASMIDHMTIKAGATIRSYPKLSPIELGVTAGGTTSKVSNGQFFLYNDFDLDSIVASELTKHRQASAYTDASAWAAYQQAMIDAVSAVYSPFTINGFATASGKASQYEPAYNALTAAIEALDECAASAGVESTQAIIDQYNPSNEEGAEYDSEGYVYFGVSDYVAYTYYNYRDEYKSAQRMIDKATIPNKETGLTETINELDKTYIEHRLSLYGSRLLPVNTEKKHLGYELAQLTRSDVYDRQNEWSAESWANFERALAFATAVNNEANAKQSKVNTALEELLEAEKRLVVGEASGDLSFELADPAGEGTVEAVETEVGSVIIGVSGEGEFEPDEYFTCEGCHVESDTEVVGTGTVLSIVSDADGSVVATFTVCVFGDFNTDAVCDANDLPQIMSFTSGAESANELNILTGDFNEDDDIDANDLPSITQVTSGASSLDYVNRVLAD